jgi:glutamate carboxypeptidase
MDTVYPIDSSFQSCTQIDTNTLNGPGVADLKGGLVVMLKALETLEASPYAENVEWEVFINPDEEIGSPGSQKLFPELAASNDLALIYEPSLSDGSIAYRRKGTGNFTLVVRGKAAHVGREFNEGASAILATAEFINQANGLNSSSVIINFGKIEGGGPLNVVPDLAILGINIRVEHSEDAARIEKAFHEIINNLNSQKHIEAKLYGSLNRKPKIPNKQLDELYNTIAECAAELGQSIQKKDTGGCCDGNNLWEFGLVNIDTMGVRGGNIHSPQEFVCLDSLVERAKLSALFLMKLGNTSSCDV